MKKALILFTALGLVTITGCKKEGCTDQTATNYSPKADVDDGSCIYDNTGGGGGTVTGTIDQDITTSTVIGSGITSVCGSITVDADLEISAGAILVMCSGADITVSSTGSINAVGTAAAPIVIKGETETPGFWKGLAIYSNNPSNRFEYVTLKDAGTYWGWEYANVFLAGNAQLSMKNSTVSNSDNVGVYAKDGAKFPVFLNNSIINNVTGLNIHPGNMKELDVNSDYSTGNDNNFIRVRGGTIGTDATWPATPTPYLIDGGITIEAGVTVNPGATIKVEAGSHLSVSSTGWLRAVGTASNMINIQGRYSTAAYWDGLAIKSNNPNNDLAYVNLSDGGSYWGYEYSNLFISGSAKVNNCTISQANNYGIYVNSSSSISSGGAVQTTPAGVESYNTFSNNGAGPNANCTTCSVFFE